MTKMNKEKHKKLLLTGLNDFFFKNQYDERFSTFRSMDRHEEVDYDGNKYYYYEVFE